LQRATEAPQRGAPQKLSALFLRNLDNSHDAFLATRALVFETSGASLHAVGHQIGPDKFDHARIIVAVGKVVVEGGEAMLLASLLLGTAAPVSRKFPGG
jgi:hypothetical protein